MTTRPTSRIDSSGLQIIDVSNPSAPALIETLDTSGEAFGVTLSSDGNTAYVADGTSGPSDYRSVGEGILNCHRHGQHYG